MRKTKGKGAIDEVRLGDPERAAWLAEALACTAEVDRWAHGFHTYPAGLHPDAAAMLVERFGQGDILDPFCGGGTVLVEARAAGRRAVGRDLSPVAVRVAAARTATPDEAVLTVFRSTARKLTAAAREADRPPPGSILDVVSGWYAEGVLCELESLRQGVAAAPPEVRPLLEVVFSSVLIKVSWRRSDTSRQRVKHDRPPGTASILFHKKARELGRRLSAYREVVPAGTPPADVQRGDARRLKLRAPVAAVITSPPYPSTYDYLPMQQLRAVWLGDDASEADEIGARRHWREGARSARRMWQEDTAAWTEACAAALDRGGLFAVVIGDGYTPAGPVDASATTEAAARAAGLRAVARASVGRPDHARGVARWEHAFLFEKGGSSRS